MSCSEHTSITSVTARRAQVEGVQRTRAGNAALQLRLLSLLREERCKGPPIAADKAEDKVAGVIAGLPLELLQLHLHLHHYLLLISAIW